MNINDFCYIQRGKIIRALPSDEANLLAPVDRRGPGRDRALLLLHGFASSPAVYRALLPALTRYDAVVCPVLPGHAASIASFANAKAVDWLASAEQACDALLQTYHTVDVMGLSLGGLLACHLSHRFALNHLYLLAPALVLQLPISVALPCAHLLHHLKIRSLRNRAGNLHTNDHAELTYRQLPITAIIEILTLIRNYQFMPPTCPVDLFLGRFDAVVNSSGVAQLFQGLPHTTIHWLNNSAHVLPLDGDIDIILACLQANSSVTSQ